MDEGYTEVIRMRVDEGNRPKLVEVRAEHLKDYRYARRMALRISWYRERHKVMESEPDFKWPKPDGTYTDHARWQGRIDTIHEGGEWFGSSMAVFHVTAPTSTLTKTCQLSEFQMRCRHRVSRRNVSKKPKALSRYRRGLAG